MRLMGVFWLGLLGFSGAVLAQDRRIGFQDRSGTTHLGASLAISRGRCCLLGIKKKVWHGMVAVRSVVQAHIMVPSP